MTTAESTIVLKWLLKCEDDFQEPLRIVAKELKGAKAEIVRDNNPVKHSAYGNSSWIVSDHKLVVEGETVAEWQRCTFGYLYGDEWRLGEDDSSSGKYLPDNVAVVLEVLGLEDSLPNVPPRNDVEKA